MRRCWVALPIAWLLLAVAATARTSRANDGDLSVAIRAVLAGAVTADGPGAIIVVLKDGSVIGQGAVGFADMARQTPITSHTLFDLASCSKQFTAIAVMILAERGKLALEDDARKFMPELPARDPPVRVCDLLHMTSGLPDYEKLLDHLEDKTNLDVLKAVTARQLLFPVGTKYNYCDTNYVLLALIVERVSGRSFAQFLKQEVFDPAGMKQAVILEQPGQPIEDRAEGYAHEKGGIRKHRDDTRTYGDGQVMASAEDLIAWDRALRENRLVRREMLTRAFTSGRLINGKPCGYGFGWLVAGRAGLHEVEHAGGWAGTSTYILRDLDRGLTVIVLSNVEKLAVRKMGRDAAEAAASPPAPVNPVRGAN